jgi:hypothetical protein
MELTPLFLFEQKAGWTAGSLYAWKREKHLLTPDGKRKAFFLLSRLQHSLYIECAVPACE